MQVDGGNVELVSIEGDVVSVRLMGTCLHCPSANLTLKQGIEQSLRKDLPWIEKVVRVP
jgi:Fe-S cluster biogenesis protein NfuA